MVVEAVFIVPHQGKKDQSRGGSGADGRDVRGGLGALRPVSIDRQGSEHYNGRGVHGEETFAGFSYNGEMNTKHFA